MQRLNCAINEVEECKLEIARAERPILKPSRLNRIKVRNGCLSFGVKKYVNLTEGCDY
jgi:hypothetical protein